MAKIRLDMDKNLFIGREYEIRQLEKYRDSKESEFIIVYGRRRVGKTFLVKEFFDDTYDFKVTGLYKKPGKAMSVFQRTHKSI